MSSAAGDQTEATAALGVPGTICSLRPATSNIREADVEHESVYVPRPSGAGDPPTHGAGPLCTIASEASQREDTTRSSGICTLPMHNVHGSCAATGGAVDACPA
jgi:hypothetical protein